MTPRKAKSLKREEEKFLQCSRKAREALLRKAKEKKP